MSIGTTALKISGDTAPLARALNQAAGDVQGLEKRFGQFRAFAGGVLAGIFGINIFDPVQRAVDALRSGIGSIVSGENARGWARFEDMLRRADRGVDVLNLGLQSTEQLQQRLARPQVSSFWDNFLGGGGVTSGTAQDRLERQLTQFEIERRGRERDDRIMGARMDFGQTDRTGLDVAQMLATIQQAEAVFANPQAAGQAIDRQLGAMGQQLQAMSMTREEAERYFLALRGATDEQLEQLSAMQQSRRELERQAEVVAELERFQTASARLEESAGGPTAAFERTLADLERRRGAGTLSEDAFTTLFGRAFGELERATGGADVLRLGGALEAGSAEAISAINSALLREQQGAASPMERVQSVLQRGLSIEERQLDVQRDLLRAFRSLQEPDEGEDI